MNNINEMKNRDAMNLSEFVSEQFVNSTEVFERTLPLTIEQLLEKVASTETVFIERWCAGVILGLRGDPRVDLLNPTMLQIPAAQVTIGSTIEQINQAYLSYKEIGVKKEWLYKEYAQHRVPIHQFKIGKYLVTNAEYAVFLKETGKGIPSSWKFGIYDPLKANHPVYGIKAEDSDNYAIWLSKKTGRNFRLPTEYEWEYAATGPAQQEFPWGDKFISDNANTLESKIFSTTPVGLFPTGASPFGCLDMAGNVEEFVANNYCAYPNGQIVHDDLNKNGEYRIARGGSFSRYSDLARCRRRHGFLEKEIYVIGFRLAEDAV